MFSDNNNIIPKNRFLCVFVKDKDRDIDKIIITVISGAEFHFTKIFLKHMKTYEAFNNSTRPYLRRGINVKINSVDCNSYIENIETAYTINNDLVFEFYINETKATCDKIKNFLLNNKWSVHATVIGEYVNMIVTLFQPKGWNLRVSML